MYSPSLPGKSLLSGSCVSEVALSLERPSRQAPLAGVPMLWLGRPGKLLLPGPCLLGPTSSSCRGLASLARQAPLAGGLDLLSCILCSGMLGLRSDPRGAVETLGAPLASLAAWCYNCSCTSSGY